LNKIVGGAPIPDEVYASKTWPFCSACKNFGAQHPLGAIECCQPNFFGSDSRCHGNKIWDIMG